MADKKNVGCLSVIVVFCAIWFVLTLINWSSGSNTSTKSTVAYEQKKPPVKPAVPVVKHLDSWEQLQESIEKKDVALVAGIEKQSWWNLCVKFGKGMRSTKEPPDYQAVMSYLDHHRLINDKDYEFIDKRRVAIGMTTCGMYAALGIPSRINRTENRYGMHEQNIYENLGSYVYTEAGRTSSNGLVTAIQN